MIEDEKWYRDFAKQYITDRLAEDERDAIEELAAYLGNWMHTRRRVQEMVARIEELERKAWQDENRTYTPQERVLAVRLDCHIERLRAA